MNVKHYPITNTNKVCETMRSRDGVEISYVCTTEIRGNNLPCDVFFRETPHPEFGNRYFAIFAAKDGVRITDADCVEEYTFVCIPDLNGNLHYSRYRHDFVDLDTGSFVDGGRAYVRIGGDLDNNYTFKVVNGQFVEVDHE